MAGSTKHRRMRLDPVPKPIMKYKLVCKHCTWVQDAVANQQILASHVHVTSEADPRETVRNGGTWTKGLCRFSTSQRHTRGDRDINRTLRDRARQAFKMVRCAPKTEIERVDT